MIARSPLVWLAFHTLIHAVFRAVEYHLGWVLLPPCASMVLNITGGIGLGALLYALSWWARSGFVGDTSGFRAIEIALRALGFGLVLANVAVVISRGHSGPYWAVAALTLAGVEPFRRALGSWGEDFWEALRVRSTYAHLSKVRPERRSRAYASSVS